MSEKYDELLKNIPSEGFIKLSSDQPTALSGADKAALIRKGNAFFNDGEYEKARRIFITTGYTDGLIRLGDWYLDQNEPLEAITMYWKAPAPDKVESWAGQAACVVAKWLGE
ncbi:MAG: hypothetical protein PQJ61_15765 [Spirochaetales bacterium]|uniref:Uncharacterized protein n=1 Tax=Candidatus Thalassospirochaeta sargassi TaxID=3119039 RepID=A0AAJ1IHE0_9SPIO|nr:hypothetical protein [Spirochaetales bacterium]